MKYIITETQHNFLKTGIPTWVLRRANEESLRKYIDKNELDYPCDYFGDEYDYADAVIDNSIDQLLGDNGDDIENEDFYSDVMDFLRTMCRNFFGEHLVDSYKNICENSETP